MFEVFPRFLFARIVLCVVLFDVEDFVGDILECAVPAWVNALCIVLGIVCGAHLCFELLVAAKVLKIRKKETPSK